MMLIFIIIIAAAAVIVAFIISSITDTASRVVCRCEDAGPITRELRIVREDACGLIC